MELIDKAFEKIERVYIRTFGPNGVAALVQGPTGSMSVTRRGWAIVQSIYEENNLRCLAVKVLFNSMKIVHKTLGDGVKSFALIEILFLKKLMHMKMSTATVNQELQNLLRAVCNMDVSSSITMSIRNKEDRVRATSALFCTSCPSVVSSLLQTVFHDWVSSSLYTVSCKNSDESFILYLQFLFKNFDLLCFRNNSGSRSVSDSYVLSGYLIDRVALNLNSSKEEQVEVELYTPETEVDELEILFRVKLIIKEKSLERSLRTLLVTTSFLSEITLFELKQHNFIVLHGVPIEDAEFISLILHQNTNILNNIVTIKSYVIGTKECSCLLLPNVFQLIICAPTNSLISEYACICKNALKHLLVTATCIQGKGLVKAGGVFEKTLHFHIAQQINKVEDPSIFLISNRKELLQWHMQNQLMKSTPLCTKGIHNDVAIRKVSVKKFKESGGILSKEKECASNLQNNVCDDSINLCKGRTCQAQKMLPTLGNAQRTGFEMNGQVFQAIDENILAVFAQSILTICNPPASAHSSEAFEPISFKMQLLHHIIATAILFFKCDITS